MKIFVTGGTGYIGSAVVRALQSSGHTTVCLARSARSAEQLERMGSQPILGDMRTRLTQALAPARQRTRVQRQLVLKVRLATKVLSSRPREFHPQPLTEPDVMLSHHPALVIQPLPAQVVPSGQKESGFVVPYCSAFVDFHLGGSSGFCASCEAMPRDVHRST